MVLRTFRFVTASEASRRSVIAIPLVAIALGAATSKVHSQELPPTQPGPPLTTGGVPTIHPTPQPTPTGDAPGRASDDSYSSSSDSLTPVLPPSLPAESKIFTLEPKYISAAEFARVLEKLLLRDDVHFVPDERTNRLLIVVSPSTEEEMARLDKRLHEIKELVDVEATRPTASDQSIQDVASWQKLVHDLQVREKDLQRQLEAVSKANQQQRNANEIEELKRMEFDVQLARIRRMRSQLDLMEAQLYENAGIARPTLAPSVPSPVPPTAPITPDATVAEPTIPGRGSEGIAPPAPALPPTPALPRTGSTPVAPKAPDSGLEYRYGDFVPAWGVAGELLRLREMAPDMDLAPVYEEALQRLNAQLEGAHAQFEAARKVRDAVEEQMKMGVASAVDLAKIEAEWVPVGARLNELKVQIRILTEQRDKILQPKSATNPSQVSR